MLLAFGAVNVKLGFQKRIHRRVDVERKPRRPLDAFHVIEPKAPRTFKKEIDFTSTQPPKFSAVIPIGFPIWFVVATHGKSVPWDEAEN